MTRNWRIQAPAAFLFTVLMTSFAQGAVSTLVQNATSWNNTASWADGPPVGGVPPVTGGGTIPDAIGAEVIFQHRVNPALGAATTHTVNLNGSRTIGTLTSNNTDNEHNTVIAGTMLTFNNGANPAVWTENEGTGTSNSSRTRITAPITLSTDLILNLHHNLRRNSSTSTTQPIFASADRTMTKNGAGNLQLEYGLTGDGFFGEVLINEGAIRLINGNSSTTNNVFAKSKGITVADGAQFQLGNGITSYSIGESSPGVKAEIKLNGIGNTNPNPDYTFNEGALRFEQSATFRFVCDFNSPIRFQTQSRIFVAGGDVTAILNEELRGDGAAGLNKGGGGLLKLATTSANGNTYAGPTNVSNGALAVNNTVASASGVGSGNVAITNGGKVGGTGVIGTVSDASNVTVTAGTLSPGDLSIDSSSGALVESAGTLTVFGDVTFASPSFLNMDIGTTSDQLVASGAIALGGSTLNLALGSFVPDGSQSFTLISNTGVSSILDTFALVNVNGVAAGGSDLDLNGVTYHLAYNSGAGGNDLVLAPGSAPAGVPGDYNNDGTVDSADYVAWRKGGPLLNEIDAPGTVNDQDYAEWVKTYGNPASGAGGGAVPEPASGLLMLLALGGVAALSTRR